MGKNYTNRAGEGVARFISIMPLNQAVAKTAVVFILLFASSSSIFSQFNPNDYRTIQSGNWNDVNTWERWNGSMWVPAPVQGTPNSNDGFITIQNGHIITISSNVSANQLTIASGAQLIVNQGQSLTFVDGTGREVTNNGSLTNKGSLNLVGRVINNGSLVNESDMTNAGNFTNNGTLISGNSAGDEFINQNRFTNNGAVTIQNGSLVNNNVIFNEAGATMTIDGMLENGDSNGDRLENSGTLINSGDIINEARILNEPGGTFTNTGNIDTGNSNNDEFSNSGTFINNGTLFRSVGAINLNAGGTIQGAGTIDMNGETLANNGTIAPGNSPGILNIIGNLVSSGTLSMEIQDVNNFDQIIVTGTATINGTLSVSFGYTPSGSFSFDLITATGGVSGSPTVAITPNTITAIFNGGTLMGMSAPLPINLTSFTAEVLPTGIQLEWRTATEQDNDYMALERSADGVVFDEIGRLPGKGTTFDPQLYRYLDQNPVAGLNYYRLRQVDFDGSTEYHPVISAVFETRGSLSVRCYPNPVQEELHIQWTVPNAGQQLLEKPAMLRVFDTQGRLLEQYALDAVAGVYNLPVARLGAGTYVLQLSQGGIVKTERFVKE